MYFWGKTFTAESELLRVPGIRKLETRIGSLERRKTRPATKFSEKYPQICRQRGFTTYARIDTIMTYTNVTCQACENTTTVNQITVEATLLNFCCQESMTEQRSPGAGRRAENLCWNAQSREKLRWKLRKTYVEKGIRGNKAAAIPRGDCFPSRVAEIFPFLRKRWVYRLSGFKGDWNFRMYCIIVYLKHCCQQRRSQPESGIGECKPLFDNIVLL